MPMVSNMKLQTWKKTPMLMVSNMKLQTWEITQMLMHEASNMGNNTNVHA
jgi:hypothetical protein